MSDTQEATPVPDQARGSLGLRLALLVFTVGICVGGAEVALRLWYHAKGRGLATARTVPYGGWAPFVGAWPDADLDGAYFMNGKRYRIRTNAHGFRTGHDFPLGPAPAGTIRVVCLGGSTTFGIALDQEDTFPVQLEAELRGGERPVQVINAGMNGLWSAPLLNVLQFKALPLEPDFVLLYTGNNDLARVFDPHWTPTYSVRKRPLMTPDPWWVARHTALGTFVWQRYLRRWLQNNSELTVEEAWRKGLSDEQKRKRGEVLAGFRRNLVSLLAMARAHGVQVVLATFVANRAKRPQEYYDDSNAILRELAASQEGVRLVDLAREWKPGPEHFLPGDAMHFSKAGEAMRARLVAEKLGEWVAGPGRD